MYLLLLWLLLLGPFLAYPSLMPIKSTAEKGPRRVSSSEKNNNCKVLAAFIDTIPEDKGWWYRLPLNQPSSCTGPSDSHPDNIMPHLGRLFGLTEMAMFVILIEMGCIEQMSTGINRGQFGINMTGWWRLNKQQKTS